MLRLGRKKETGAEAVSTLLDEHRFESSTDDTDCLETHIMFGTGQNMKLKEDSGWEQCVFMLTALTHHRLVETWEMSRA